MKKSLQHKHLFIYLTKRLKIFDPNIYDIGIIDSVFGKVNLNLGSKAIFIRFDNASCYHNKSLVTILHFYAIKLGHAMKCLDFNELSAGKDICD